MKTTYNKLIRDKIPQKIEAAGKTSKQSTLSHEDYVKELNNKLTEESNEWFESSDVEELADILEVVMALAAEKGVGFEQLVEIANSKRDKRGGFKERLFLEEVYE
ncbi:MULTISPECIES: nucleoside triphosphate pyrophosphohydrolase [unclassified Fusibacter]|uniref:nucleoside triphosphate pyrophosphohydrolase n=1 Tax=unclassified Fusibacter TaxID=2624464 RepID=UPI001012AF28|nr:MULTISPECIES: nucleoside triphosphate pyrophosphohydrolase [unclassified Fusibacter]MCK8058399.1 nucleoside triphosphate pyrophosphohydrolase [Fusibacter sp. A2]NPE20981.1 nucleoside triphosphate pyrophosphohydrolase [Fusibacter sp. A1]RXV63182.1 phosphoribosyl-ATP pyrophosphohydrolase [Fusibacter sp. A1]